MAARTRATVLFFVAALLLGFAILFDFMEQIIDSQIKRQVELATNKQIQKLWSRPPIEARSAFWLYNIENADQYLNFGAKARVRKVGPFNFRSQLEKNIISISENKLKIVYNSTRYTRLANIDSSNATTTATATSMSTPLDEQLTLVNVLYASLVSATRELTAKLGDATMRKIAAGTVDRLAAKYNETLLLNMSAREALLGRPVPVLAKLAKLAETFGNDNQASGGGGVETPRLPPLPESGLFGFASLTNGSWVGPMEVFTGYGPSANSLGDIVSFQGKRRLSIYSGRCNRLQASAGELRPMPLADGQTLEMFRPEVCRVLRLEQAGSVRLPAGRAFKYKFSQQDFQSAYSNPDNRCYCYNSSVPPFENYCSLNGVIEPGPCVMHAPIILAFAPIDFDPRIKESIENWHDALFEPTLDDLPEQTPNVDFNLLVLRRIGVPIKVDVTVIAFVKVRRDLSKKQLASVPEVSYLPAFMSRDLVELPPQFERYIVSVERFIELSARMRIVMYMSAVIVLLWLASAHYSKLDAAQKLATSKQQQQQNNSNKQNNNNNNNNDYDNNNNNYNEEYDDNVVNSNAANLTKQQQRFKRQTARKRTPLDKLDAGFLAVNVGSLATSADGVLTAVSASSKPQVQDACRTTQASNDSAQLTAPARVASEQQQAAAAVTSAAVKSVAATNEKINPNNSGNTSDSAPTMLATPPRRALVFSKLDDELAEQDAKKRAKDNAKQASIDNNNNDNNIDVNANNTNNQNDNNGSLNNNNNNNVNDDDDDNENKNDASDNAPRMQQRRPHWISQVYTAFVRALIGLRPPVGKERKTTIGASTSLENANESPMTLVVGKQVDKDQDRRLEELASKIANWGATTPSSDDELDGGGGGVMRDKRQSAQLAAAESAHKSERAEMLLAVDERDETSARQDEQQQQQQQQQQKSQKQQKQQRLNEIQSNGGSNNSVTNDKVANERQLSTNNNSSNDNAATASDAVAVTAATATTAADVDVSAVERSSLTLSSPPPPVAVQVDVDSTTNDAPTSGNNELNGELRRKQQLATQRQLPKLVSGKLEAAVEADETTTTTKTTMIERNNDITNAKNRANNNSKDNSTSNSNGNSYSNTNFDDEDDANDNDNDANEDVDDVVADIHAALAASNAKNTTFLNSVKGEQRQAIAGAV